MRIFFQPSQLDTNKHAIFKGKTETFWKVYNKQMQNIPLKETIIKSISDKTNFLGEGINKKGFNLSGFKNYVIRIYKQNFNKEDLNLDFVKPKASVLNTLEEVVLCIPNKIDIVKKKHGEEIGIHNYAKRLHVHEINPLENVGVTREETLKSLMLYEQLKDFPLKSYKRAYSQLKNFCKNKGYQFDIISPNNILVDLKNKQINLIDPVTPIVNKGVHGSDVDFSEYHGCDSLYPTLCDFLLQEDHLKNLTESEKQRWDDSIGKIIAKCIAASKSLNLNHNIEKLRILYENIDRFWKSNEICRRYDNFMNKFSPVINLSETIETAINYKNPENIRINAIKQINCPDFSEVESVLKKILEAPHQPKIEFPEIINPTLDKISEYGKDAKNIIPTLENLFNKEIFYTTKKRLYNLFITIEPENNRFLEEIEKSSNNFFEKNLYKEEFERLYKTKKISKENKTKIINIYKNFLKREDLPQHLIDKLWISRTCTTNGISQKIAFENMLEAYNYIETVKDKTPQIKDLIELHKLVMKNIPEKEFIVGRLRTPDTDQMIQKIFNIQKKPENTVLVCDYSASKDVIDDLKIFQKYINDNCTNDDIFKVAANIFSEVIRIHPFLDANGRVARLFTEQYLLHRGFRLTKWSEDILYRKISSPQKMAESLKNYSIPINNTEKI